MASSVSDFCTKVNAVTPSSGAVFSTQLNSDGTVSVYRAPSSSAPGPGVLLYRVRYTQFFDTVSIGDGSLMTTQNAVAWIASLN
jgi:hypothetical protein